ncbi:hypothetical protein ACROYT_G038964 [Oculina patagonica]
MTGMLDVDLCRASFPRVMNLLGKDNYTSVLLVGFQCTQTRTKMMPWCEDRGSRKSAEYHYQSTQTRIKWLADVSIEDLRKMNYKCIFKRRRRGLSKELSDVPVLGSISKDLNLTQSLKECQAFIDLESGQDSVSNDKHD